MLLAVIEVRADAVALTGTYHADHRTTPKLVLPDSSSAQVKSAEEYLQTHSARFKIPATLSNLERVSTRTSLLGTHARYQQTLNGLPVEGAEIIVSRRKADGSVFQVYNNTYPVEAPVSAAKTTVGEEAALQAAWNHLRVHGQLKVLPETDLVYTPVGTGFRLIYKTLIIVDAPYGYWEHKIDALSGEVISVRRHEISEKHAPDDVPDFSIYNGPTSSLSAELHRLKEAATAAASAKTSDVSSMATADGTALVFDPDPRTTLMNDNLLDTSPAATFDPAYFTRTLRDITLDAGTYYLRGPWVTITNAPTELPATEVSTSPNGNWTAKRGNNAFNDVMCYFHIDQNQRYIQSLGYVGAAGIQDVSIPIDSDGLDGDDNSHYVGSLNLIAFGHGGVDDDEDADVILHEYGHALTYDTTPTFGGGDSGGIGEGFGDYWGASYSWTTLNGSTHHPEWAFSWDGHGPDTWSGRRLDMTNLTYNHATAYEAHMTISGIPNYSDQLWGTPIFQAFLDLINMGRPREEMDRIILESFFGVGYGVKMRDLATSTVRAALELYPDGPHASVYYNRFEDQQIMLEFPLPTPTLTYPVGGETFTTATIVNVQWNRNGAPPRAAARIEYNSDVGFFDNVEGGINGWTTSTTGAGSDWLIATTDSHSPAHSWFATDDPTVGDQFLTRSDIAVDNDDSLSFWHSYDLETEYDGAVVEISINGTTWEDLGSKATLNGYNATISSSYGSAIGGRSAFSGNSSGFIKTIIPLGDYVGQTVSIRFRESDDSSISDVGWWVDDIVISSGQQWVPVAVTPTNTSNYAWTLPGQPGTSYGVRVRLTGSNCTDSGWSVSKAFSLEVSTNASPTDISVSQTNVPENLPIGTTIGTFTTQDPDPGDTFTYTLVPGPGSMDNDAFTVSGSNLLTALSFNHEAKSNFSARVQSADQGSLSTQKTFAIHITDVNEPPPAVFVPEETTNGTTVVRWSSIANHTYTIHFSTNLLTGFSVLESNILATPVINSYTDTVTTLPRRFWKVTTDP